MKDPNPLGIRRFPFEHPRGGFNTYDVDRMLTPEGTIEGTVQKTGPNGKLFDPVPLGPESFRQPIRVDKK